MNVLILSGFYMQGYMCPLAKAGLQRLLYLTGAGMRVGEGHRAIHADMEFDGVAATDTASTEVVRVADVGERIDNFQNLSLNLVGQ